MSENSLIKVEIFEKDGVYVVSSRVIAKYLGKEHNKVLRTLDKLCEKPNVAFLIIPSTYKVEGQNKEYKEYLLTKNGFILYMFNIQGYEEFKLAYINEFDRMENYIKSKQNPYFNMSKEQMMIEVLKDQEQLKLEVKEHKEKLDILEQRVKEKITLDYHQQRKVQREVALRVEEILLNRPDLSDKKRLLFASIYRSIKNTFGVASYNDVLEDNLNDCLRLIQGFVVPYNFGEDK